MEICFCPPYLFVAIDAHGHTEQLVAKGLLWALKQMAHVGFRYGGRAGDIKG